MPTNGKFPPASYAWRGVQNRSPARERCARQATDRAKQSPQETARNRKKPQETARNRKGPLEVDDEPAPLSPLFRSATFTVLGAPPSFFTDSRGHLPARRFFCDAGSAGWSGRGLILFRSYSSPLRLPRRLFHWTCTASRVNRPDWGGPVETDREKSSLPLPMTGPG